jgi:hypothetical protein
MTNDQICARSANVPQEVRVMLQSVLEPVFLRIESNQHSRGTAMARDDDLFRRRELQVAGEVILDLRQSHPLRMGHPRLFNPKPKLRLIQAAQPSDAALARLRGLMPQVTLDAVPQLRPQARRQRTQLAYRIRRQDDRVAPSGQILASSNGTRQGRSNAQVTRSWSVHHRSVPDVRRGPSRRPPRPGDERLERGETPLRPQRWSQPPRPGRPDHPDE